MLAALSELIHPFLFVCQGPRRSSKATKVPLHAFSLKTLRETESTVRHYVDQFVHRVGQNGGPKTRGVDTSTVYNWLTFDIIADLTFGKSFNSIFDWKPSAWVSLLLDFTSHLTLLPVISRLSVPGSVLPFLMPKALKQSLDLHNKMTEEMVEHRIKLGDLHDREDFFAQTIPKETLISREITGDSTSGLTYLNAVIEEGLRLFPPAPFGLPRVCPGATINGLFIPKGTIVSVDTYTVSHDARNFPQPNNFIPDRWIDREWKVNRDASRPFSLGPRGCLGMNLAYLEARMTLASLVYAYDLELINQDTDWFSHVTFHTVWKKPPLMVRFHPRDISA
ncbi:hypothetical protein FPOA_12555 [Fusarium poae]|uniref:Cytochrome P450 monooxygenase n=1 Tax=Fusarium poae TaxID=36050 RepID=A0A1B8A8Q6_FUSPO|nr:hypothetical protein FPOA_12555 [Fusarium poae]